jgi:hypothetical protein
MKAWRTLDLYIASGKDKHEATPAPATGPPPNETTIKQAMRHKLRTEAGRCFTK